jgi:lipopolysaccharide/colanic/teichoic acid biosynthesis glycosyltransferase
MLILLFTNGRKVFYIQPRPGKNEKPFYLYKFKTMSDKKDKNGDLLPDVERITKFGAFLRKFSMDEIPQLFNVLKGDMSLVGPRPLLFKYIPLYNERQRKRHLVRPGITGLAQVSGRNTISWEKKFEYDVQYVENVSLFLDLKILSKTFVKVIAGQGINQSPERPMQPFNGFN